MSASWEFTDWEPNLACRITNIFTSRSLHSLWHLKQLTLICMLLLFLPLMLFYIFEVCPKNFIIFDQTDNQSTIMFHLAMANKYSGPVLHVHATYNQDSEKNKANLVEGELSSPFEEDSKDIDALLSLEGEELEDHDEEELSIARTSENYESICLVDIKSVFGLKRMDDTLFCLVS